MVENSGIEWTDHTFNPWVGCTKISPACDHCYAEGWAKRTGNGDLWQGERRRTSAANWRQPLKWQREAKAAGRRAKVFCASLADVFDNQADPAWRADLWELIHATPDLDWLLLTKRPQNIAKMLPADWVSAYHRRYWWPNVWLGTTAENQAQLEIRVRHLAPIACAVRFLSCEPLLGPLDLSPQVWTWANIEEFGGVGSELIPIGKACDWIIGGGESGPGARPMDPAWARSLRDQCREHRRPFFFKQWGEYHPHGELLRDGSVNALGNPDDARWHQFDGGGTAWRVGKKAADALLDGREWREFPAMDAEAGNG